MRLNQHKELQVKYHMSEQKIMAPFFSSAIQSTGHPVSQILVFLGKVVNNPNLPSVNKCIRYQVKSKHSQNTYLGTRE